MSEPVGEGEPPEPPEPSQRPEPSGASASEPASAGRLDAAERAELARLRTEVAELKAGRRTPGHTARAVGAVVLIVLGCLLAPLAVVAAWSGGQIADADRYVDTVAPLAESPAVQNAVADRVTTEIVDRLDVPKLVDEALNALEGRGLPAQLGDRLNGLSGPLENALTSFIRDKALDFVKSDTFETLWVRANRQAHTQLNAVLSGQGSKVLKTEGTTVSLDLGPVITEVKQRLVARGLGAAGAIPEIHPTFEVFDSPALVKAQRWYQILGALRWVLPVLSLILITAGVYTARGHRRALIAAALGVVGAMLLLALALLAGRAYFLDAVAVRGLNTAAAGAMYDALITFLRSTLRMVAVVALVVGAGAFLTGRSAAAVRTRETLSAGLARLRGRDHGSRWVYDHRRLLRTGLVLVAILVFFFWNYPTGLVVLLITLLVLLALAVVEALARPPDG
ncbi:hypothetical protein EDD29_6344 [Actinocorallia herbida]|uniref:Integral membrane protein n=1 Tax=Actinocorallia herbida TaxID=58109 RepID=A0A3N1D5A2_9ACTN|nr:hypothetical protein [Actinocorallia herbida]ROO88670.1 hypothetical protein EDD29_6344 [Actinocorallia herbida]